MIGLPGIISQLYGDWASNTTFEGPAVRTGTETEVRPVTAPELA